MFGRDLSNEGASDAPVLRREELEHTRLEAESMELGGYADITEPSDEVRE